MPKDSFAKLSFLHNGPKFELASFTRSGMGTIFGVHIAEEQKEYAEQAAHAAFEELDRLEQDLSRFIPTSDVSRINSSHPGERVTVGPATYDCLRMARRVWRDTNGAFDVTIGPLLACWKHAEKEGKPPSAKEIEKALTNVGMDLLDLNDEQHSVAVLREGVQVDLGGIGKGYAVDRMIDVLREWEIRSAIVHGGKSSVFGTNPPKGYNAWEVTIRDPQKDDRILGVVSLRNRSLSGSGIRIHGHHIIDPRTGGAVMRKVGAWAVASSATLSDALSTAFMVMGKNEVKSYCSAHPKTAALLAWPACPVPRVALFGDATCFSPAR